MKSNDRVSALAQGDVARCPERAARRLTSLARCRHVPFFSTALGVVVAAATLVGCGSDGASTFIVDPARYSVYHCKDMVTQLKTLLTREQELRALMDRASEGTGGATIGAVAYRADYEKAVGEERLLRRAAAAKKCELVTTYQSDQSIR